MAKGTCTFDGCGYASFKAGLCQAHYAQKRRGGPLRPVRNRKQPEPVRCEGPDCEHWADYGGLCGSHHRQVRQGRELSPLRVTMPGGESAAKVRDHEGRKLCPPCGRWLVEGHFHRSAREPDGLAGWCRDCNAAAQRRWALATKYGMTPDAYDAIAEQQGNVCAICREACTRGSALSVDHDHRCCPGDRSCGKCIRGLLCRACNIALGNMRDDPAIVRRAAEYLEQAG